MKYTDENTFHRWNESSKINTKVRFKKKKEKKKPRLFKIFDIFMALDITHCAEQLKQHFDPKEIFLAKVLKIDFEWHANLLRVISCLEVRELHTLYIYIFVSFKRVAESCWLVGSILWPIKPCRFFNAKSCLYMCIKYIISKLRVHS